MRGVARGPSAAFDKSTDLFPVKRDHVDLATCSIGPTYAHAAAAAQAFIRAMSERGMGLHADFGDALTRFRQPVAELFGVGPDDVAYVSNTAEGIGLIANGYPFEPGDQVISYVHEFPSNHYPWTLQRERGVDVVLLSDADPGVGLREGRPRAWSMDELRERATDRTRVIALSHVQFASGYAADLNELGGFCAGRGIDLIVDASQSLGVLPVLPRACGAAAVVSACWKWLLGPRGAGLAYLSPGLRAKLRTTMAGDAMMTHTLDYLNHTWEPVETARRLEYSTLPWEHLFAIETVVREVFLRYGIDAVRDEVFRLQDVFVAALDTDRIRPVRFPDAHRSGILALDTDRDPKELVAELREEGILGTSQGGYVRVAAHFYLDDDDMARVAEVFGRIG